MDIIDSINEKIAIQRKNRISQWTKNTSEIYDEIVEKIQNEIDNCHCFESTLESFRNFLILAREIMNTKEEDINKDEYVSQEMQNIHKQVCRLIGRNQTKE